LSLGRFRYSNPRNVVQCKSPSYSQSLPLRLSNSLGKGRWMQDVHMLIYQGDNHFRLCCFCRSSFVISARIYSTRLGIGPLESQLLAYEWRRYLMIKKGFKGHHSVRRTDRRLRGVFYKRCRTQDPNSVE